MGVQNQKKEKLNRIEAKNLDAQFLGIIQEGLNCSSFESVAVLKAVKEVYFPFLEETAPKSPPGKITLIAVDSDEPSGKSISECAKRTVSLTVHRGAVDDKLLIESGPAGFRRARIPDLCQEALSQGAVLTCEDLAHHVFFVTTRTITRDISELRKKNPLCPVPIRSTIQDIGPVLTHRVQIVKLALDGKTTTQICNIMRHSPQAVSNYVSTFTRCAQLVQKNLEVEQIAFLLNRGKGLIRQYVDLLEQCKRDKNMEYHLNELLQLSQNPEKKNRSGRCNND